MTSAAFMHIAGDPCVSSYPAASTRVLSGVGVVGQLRLPTDPIGVFILTLNGIVAGSAVQIETAAGAPLENRAGVGATETFTTPAYAVGSPLNDLVVKVRKGTAAPFYQPYQTQVTAFAGAASAFVSQTPDE